MYKGAMRAGLVGAFAIFVAGLSSAQVTLGSVGDADAVAGTSNTGDDYSDNNFGARGWIAENWTGATEVIAHIQFDVSGFAAGSIQSATLRLFHDFNNANGVTYEVHQVLQAWNEATLTHQNRPTLAGAAASSLTISDNSSGLYREWDVTALVQSWVDGGADNFGMAIVRMPNAGPWHYFRSKENTSGNNPQLVVESVVPEPASLAALGLGAAALLRKRRK